MNKPSGILICCLLWCGVASAAPPTDESLEELMSAGNVHQLLSSVQSQMEATMKGAANQALEGKSLTPERQAIVDRSLKPMFFRIYRQSFSQEDVDGIIAFYKTPAGQAMISKMPLVMQNTMAEMRQMLKPLQQKMVEIQQEAIDEIERRRPTSRNMRAFALLRAGALRSFGPARLYFPRQSRQPITRPLNMTWRRQLPSGARSRHSIGRTHIAR